MDNYTKCNLKLGLSEDGEYLVMVSVKEDKRTGLENMLVKLYSQIRGYFGRCTCDVCVSKVKKLDEATVGTYVFGNGDLYSAVSVERILDCLEDTDLFDTLMHTHPDSDIDTYMSHIHYAFSPWAVLFSCFYLEYKSACAYYSHS